MRSVNCLVCQVLIIQNVLHVHVPSIMIKHYRNVMNAPQDISKTQIVMINVLKKIDVNLIRTSDQKTHAMTVLHVKLGIQLMKAKMAVTNLMTFVSVFKNIIITKENVKIVTFSKYKMPIPKDVLMFQPFLYQTHTWEHRRSAITLIHVKMGLELMKTKMDAFLIVNVAVQL